jgi:hypothetical protein
MAWHSYHHALNKEKQFQNKNIQAQDSTSYFNDKPCEATYPDCIKNSQVWQLSKDRSSHTSELGSKMFAHDAKTGEVTLLALDLLILL